METLIRLQGNIWKFALLLIANKRVFAAILGAYYLTIPEVTAQTIGLILAISSVAGFVFEIPSGYISDKIGHKTALVISRVCMVISTLFFLLANNVILLIIGSVFFSASEAFHSGTGSAFMHDTLRALKRDQDYTKIMGKVSAVGFSIPIFFSAFAPFLVEISYKAPFVLSLVIDSIGLLAATSLVTPPGRQKHIEEIRTTNFKQVVQEGYRLNFFPIVIVSALMTGTLFAVGSFRAPYQVFLEIPVIWFGVFFGAGRLLASLILAYSGKLKNFFNLVSFYQFQIGVFMCCIFALGLITTPWIVLALFILINAYKWGLSRLDEGYQLELIHASKFKATLLSVSAQFDQAVGAIVCFLLGVLIESSSYAKGFLIIGISLLVVLLPLCVFISFKYKKYTPRLEQF